MNAAEIAVLRDLVDGAWMNTDSESGERISDERADELHAEDGVVYVCLHCGDQTRNGDPQQHGLWMDGPPCPVRLAAIMVAESGSAPAPEKGKPHRCPYCNAECVCKEADCAKIPHGVEVMSENKSTD